MQKNQNKKVTQIFHQNHFQIHTFGTLYVQYSKSRYVIFVIELIFTSEKDWEREACVKTKQHKLPFFLSYLVNSITLLILSHHLYTYILIKRNLLLFVFLSLFCSIYYVHRNVPEHLVLSLWCEPRVLLMRNSILIMRILDTLLSSGISSWPSHLSSVWSPRTIFKSEIPLFSWQRY